ncbi:MAG: hypothetical protein QM817_40395 [Archangium sp.]
MSSARASEAPWLIDSVRASAYRVFKPLLGGLYANRDRRVAWLGVFSVVTSFALTLLAPMWLLAVGPILLGVPHLVADARYLVAQPKLHERGPWVWLAALPLVASGFGAPPAIALLVLVPSVLAARASLQRKLVGLAVWFALTVVAVLWATPFLYAFLHLHNLVALGWWWALRPRSRVSVLVPVLVVLGTLALLFGAADSFIATWAAPLTATSLTEFVASNAPVSDGVLGARLVLSFAFLQSVHYAMWLRLVPEDARRRPAPRPFRETWRALEQDFGLPLLVVFLALSVFIAAWGVFDLAEARLGYLRLAAFHGYLEFGAAALFLVEGRRAALSC